MRFGRESPAPVLLPAVSWTIINGDELLVVSGIEAHARRLGELRVHFGWAIVSGVTIKEMSEDELKAMRPNDNVLLSAAEDRDAAHRWSIANTVRKEPGSVRGKIPKFLRENAGRGVTNEALRYVAGDKT